MFTQWCFLHVSVHSSIHCYNPVHWVNHCALFSKHAKPEWWTHLQNGSETFSLVHTACTPIALETWESTGHCRFAGVNPMHVKTGDIPAIRAALLNPDTTTWCSPAAVTQGNTENAADSQSCQSIQPAYSRTANSTVFWSPMLVATCWPLCKHALTHVQVWSRLFILQLTCLFMCVRCLLLRWKKIGLFQSEKVETTGRKWCC